MSHSIGISGSVAAALYARVSSDTQAKAGTIQSQIDAILRRAVEDGLNIGPELRFIDEGYSGATLIRPALERLRDTAAAGGIDRLYVLCPDRLSREYAYQMVLVDEFRRCGVELIFINHQLGQTPEDTLLLQVQGMMAEYERAKILERSRRGKLHGARQGRVNVLGSAPYGYRYVPGAGGAAQYTVHLPEASVVRQIFQWVAMDRISLSQICKKLEKQGVLSPSGMNRWRASSVRVILGNPAYKGAAAYGKTCRGPMRRRPRPVRNGTGIPRGGQSIYKAPKEQWISIAVPALVDESLFDAAARQLEENRSRLRQRAAGPRHLLQGLLVCKHCGYACCGYRSGTPGKAIYCHYRCTGNQANRFNGQRVCTSPSLRQDALDDAVWNDVRQFLAEPARVEHELQRRLGGDDDGSQQQMNQKLGAQAGKSRRAIARLIDAYEQGLLEKGEFEPRIKSARQQLSLLEEQLQEQVDQQERAREMRLVMDNLETFSRQVMSGLDQADWQTRRDIITTLVKQVEVGSQEVRIVYRVDLGPFDRCPERGILTILFGTPLASFTDS